jgi:hypothetical protein
MGCASCGRGTVCLLQSNREHSVTPVIIVILVHNERAMIGCCLSPLIGGALDRVVVCNACTSGTEQIARTFGPGFVSHDSGCVGDVLIAVRCSPPDIRCIATRKPAMKIIHARSFNLKRKGQAS